MSEEHHVKEQEVHFSSLKSLWLSKIPTNVRQQLFPDALEQLPSRMVTTSRFCNVFFPSLGQRRERALNAERSWFGIRSILKGGVLAKEPSDKYDESDFRQLGEIKGKDQIPKSHTESDFTDTELKSLISIYRDYQKWLRRNGFYDDIDLVLRALDQYKGEGEQAATQRDAEFTKNLQRNRTEIETVIHKLRFNDQRVVFKDAALKEIEKISKNKDDLEIIVGWVTRNIIHRSRGRAIVKDIPGRRVHNQDGVPIYKSKLTKGGRIYWTPIDNGVNSFTIVIYDFCMKKENGDPRLEKLVKNWDGDDSDDDSDDLPSNAEISDVTIDETPGTGKRPWLINLEKYAGVGLTDALLNDANIQLDEHQKKSILANQPSLIDGLAGTGKTSVVSYRGVVRSALSPEGTKILVTASKDHVVRKISETMDFIHTHGDWSGELAFKMNRTLAPGMSHNATATLNLSNFSSRHPSEGFDEIILDECQDITPVEFKMLSRLLVGHNLRRLVFSGDPLQTLNPTGFDWGKIKAMFVDGGVNLENVHLTQFYNNYRSQRKIVDFSNSVQITRTHVLGNPNRGITLMNAIKAEAGKLRIIEYNPRAENHVSAVSEIIRNAGESKAIVITPSPDDLGVKSMLVGGNDDPNPVDPVMADVWREVTDNAESAVDPLDFRQHLFLHSASSVKGAEYNVVVLYRFASEEHLRTLLRFLNQDIDELVRIGNLEKISVRYAFSRLYVALTRAFERVYFIEDPSGFEFWKSMKAFGPDKTSIDIDSLIDFVAYRDPTIAKNSQDLAPEVEATRENYENERDKFERDPSDLIALELAINLARRLMKNEPSLELRRELWNLEGELAWYKSRQPGLADSERQKFRDQALEFFTKAGEHDKAGPIFFSNKDFEKCLETVKNSGRGFYKLVKAACEIRLEIFDLSNEPDQRTEQLMELYVLLDPSIRPLNQWQKIAASEECHSILRAFILRSFSASELTAIRETRDHFSITEMLEQFEDPADVMMILEYFRLNRSHVWKGVYCKNFIQYVKSIPDAVRRCEAFMEKKEFVAKSDLASDEVKDVWKDLLILLLEMKEPLKDSSSDLFTLIHTLGNARKSMGRYHDPMEILNPQIRVLYVVGELGELGHPTQVLSPLIEHHSALYGRSHDLFRSGDELGAVLDLFESPPKHLQMPPQLAWLNSDNVVNLLDNYVRKLFDDSVVETQRGKERHDAWNKLITKQLKVRGDRGIAKRKAEKQLDDFYSWMGHFHRYAMITTFNRAKQRIMDSLFEWTSHQHFNMVRSGLPVMDAIWNSLDADREIFPAERGFFLSLLRHHDDWPKEASKKRDEYYKLLCTFKDREVSRHAQKAFWEYKHDRFMKQLENGDLKSDNQQKKLKEYLVLLSELEFVKEVEIATKYLKLGDDEIQNRIDELYDQKDFEGICNFICDRSIDISKVELSFTIEDFEYDAEWWTARALGRLTEIDSTTHLKVSTQGEIDGGDTSANVVLRFLLLSKDATEFCEVCWESRDQFKSDSMGYNIFSELVEHFMPKPIATARKKVNEIDPFERFFVFVMWMGDQTSKVTFDFLTEDEIIILTDQASYRPKEFDTTRKRYFS